MLNFRNDPTAFKAFINEHQDKVYNIVLNRVQNAEDAEEITQDVFIAIFKNPKAFRGEATISTWIYRIAINKCIDHLRKKNKGWRILTGFFNSSNIGDDGPKDFLHPGAVNENKEKAMMLFRAMKKLPPNQHTAWLLSEMENLSYSQISEIMKLSVSSIESLLFRARQKLKKILSEIYPGDD